LFLPATACVCVPCELGWTLETAVLTRYDFSPLGTLTQQKRKPLLAFLINTCAIVGGLFTTIGILLNMGTAASLSCYSLALKHSSTLGLGSLVGLQAIPPPLPLRRRRRLAYKTRQSTKVLETISMKCDKLTSDMRAIASVLFRSSSVCIHTCFDSAEGFCHVIDATMAMAIHAAGSGAVAALCAVGSVTVPAPRWLVRSSVGIGHCQSHRNLGRNRRVGLAWPRGHDASRDPGVCASPELRSRSASDFGRAHGDGPHLQAPLAAGHVMVRVQ
jgi:hypothetical protein